MKLKIFGANLRDQSKGAFVVNAWTPELVRQWLEHSPTEPGPIAEGLRGWCIGYNFFCSRCCGRLAARGMLLPREASPVWADRNPEFAVCAACGNPAK